MLQINASHRITDVGELERLYGAPSQPALAKEVSFIHPVYRQFISRSPFIVLATGGEGGLDTSPRGDAPGFVVVEDDRTLLIPDRPGNNRIDSLRNIVENPRVAVFFLVPGVGESLRVNGRASILVDPDLLARFVVNAKPPRSVIVIDVETAFFQCSKAIVRSDLWNPEKRIDRAELPSTGAMLAELSKGRIDGSEFDREMPERIRQTLY
jgi:hypothetical protein